MHRLHQYLEFRLIGIPQKSGSTIQLERWNAMNNWRIVCCYWLYKPLTWSRAESTHSSYKQIGRLPAWEEIARKKREERRYEDEKKREGEEGEEKKKKKIKLEQDESSLLSRMAPSQRGGTGPPPCSPAATGSHPPVPYVIRIIYVCACVRARLKSIKDTRTYWRTEDRRRRRTPLRY